MTAGSRADAERLGSVLVGLTRRPEARSVDPLVDLDRIPFDQLVELAAYHRVPGVVYRSLVDLGVDDGRLGGLRATYQGAALGHGRCLLELVGAVDFLAALDRPWLVVKGPVLTDIGYRDPGARLYEDLDLLVAPDDLGPALSLIERSGGSVPELNWPLMTRQRRAEVPVILPSGMSGDLHWHLSVTTNIRSRFSLPLDEMVERRRPVPVGSVEVETLDVVDGLLYLCLHGSLSGGHQLVWLKDLEVMIDREPPDWDELVRRARRYGADLVAALQLDRARTVLGAPVPEAVVDALAADDRWWRWWRAREERVGAARWGGYDRTGRTFVSATSRGLGPSLVQLSRSLVVDVARPAVWERLPMTGVAQPGYVPPLYRPMGGAKGRSDYLATVRSGAWG